MRPSMRSAITLLATALLASSAGAARAATDDEVRQIVAEEVEPLLRGAGAAVAVRANGRTLLFAFGHADRARKRLVTADSLFNLASVSKIFDATLLALLTLQGEISFDDPVRSHVSELRRARDVGQITLGQLASFTAGLALPHELPPYPAEYFTLQKFLTVLKNWEIHPDHMSGQHYLYSHAGYMLLHVALERRFGMSYGKLLEQRLLRPLGLVATALPTRGRDSVGELAPWLKRRYVQGYSEDGKPIGKPGDMQGHYYWPGSGQMFSSARDMADFLVVHLGDHPNNPRMRQAAALTHRGVAMIEPQRVQAYGWEMRHRTLTIVDKNGGLSNSTTYIGMIPSRRLGIAILINRGWLDGREIGHPILLRLGLLEDR